MNVFEKFRRENERQGKGKNQDDSQVSGLRGLMEVYPQGFIHTHIWNRKQFSFGHVTFDIFIIYSSGCV